MCCLLSKSNPLQSLYSCTAIVLSTSSILLSFIFQFKFLRLLLLWNFIKVCVKFLCHRQLLDSHVPDLLCLKSDIISDRFGSRSGFVFYNFRSLQMCAVQKKKRRRGKLLARFVMVELTCSGSSLRLDMDTNICR